MSTQIIHIRKWVPVAIINFMIVAVYGWLMRYKISYSLPFLFQKYLLHAHSHFAFSGWVTQLLMIFLIGLLPATLSNGRRTLYRTLLYANLINAYGVLISFTIQGYALFSITFSTLGLIVSFLFAGFYIYDSLKMNFSKAKLWFIAALVFQTLSAAGTLSLGYMMGRKSIDINTYHASIYWYLHFQYNGWFMFALIGLFIDFLYKKMPEFRMPSSFFVILLLSCAPTYGLSIPWMLPTWADIVTGIGTIAQAVAWFIFFYQIIRLKAIRHISDSFGRMLVILIGLAVFVKITLQLISLFPLISQMAFGHRPIVIAYLHLILLGIISMYLISHLYITGNLKISPYLNISIITLLASVILNEIVLITQGISSLVYILVPWTNLALLVVSSGILLSIISIFISQFSPTGRQKKIERVYGTQPFIKVKLPEHQLENKNNI